MNSELTEIQFVQIQCVSVPNVSTTQCHVFMYGLDSRGEGLV